MIQNLYTVYDEITLIYNPPFPAHNHKDAIRIATLATNNPNSSISNSPEDYSIYYIAAYDNEIGEFTNIFPKEFIVRCKSLVNINTSEEI